jgi:small GTP-binding protein
LGKKEQVDLDELMHCPKEAPVPVYKFVFLGRSGVGKSATCLQFVQQMFVSEYDPTIENSYRKVHQGVMLDLLDTAGGAEGNFMNKDAYIWAGEGFLVVYSVSCASSLNVAEEYMERVATIKDRVDFPMVLCANKKDLRSKERVVTTKEGRALADRFGAEFFGTSAKTGENVEEAVTMLVDVMRAVQYGGMTLRVARWLVRSVLVWCLKERGIPRELQQNICSFVYVGWREVASIGSPSANQSAPEARRTRTRRCMLM